MLLLLCIKIFFARIVDVTFGTIRTVLVVRGRRFTPAIIAFFEVLIWFLVAREALTTDIKSIIIPICYAGGYATGTFIGGYISNNLVEGLIGVQVTTKTSDVKKMIKEIRDAGFGVSVVDLKNPQDNEKKTMLMIQLNKSKLKKLTHIIRTNDKDAFVVINDTKYVQNGVIK